MLVNEGGASRKTGKTTIHSTKRAQSYKYEVASEFIGGAPTPTKRAPKIFFRTTDSWSLNTTAPSRATLASWLDAGFQ